MARTYLEEVLADAPSGLWRLDEGAGNYLDRSGNAFDLTPSGAITRGVAGAVLNFNAAEFHGGLATITQQAALDPTTGITQEAWINVPSSWASFWGVISKTIGDVAGTKAMLFVDDTGNLNFTLSTTITNGTPRTVSSHNGRGWIHVVATWDGSNARIYVNGVQQRLTGGIVDYPLTGTIRTGTGGLYVGATAPGTYNPNAGGQIQYAAQYSTALSAARVLAHYQAQNNPATPNTPTPANGSNGNPLSTTLLWASAGATAYDLYFGTTNPPTLYAANLNAANYSPPLNSGTIYYWQIVGKAGVSNPGTNAGPVWTFQVAQAASPAFGLVHQTQMAATGNADATLVDDTKWNAAHHAPAFAVLCAAEDQAIAWLNMPAAETPFRGGFSYPDAVIDFKYATQGRLIVNVATPGAAGAQLRVKRADLSTGGTAYPDGNNGFAVLIDSAGLKDSGWVNLDNPTITAGDVEVLVFGANGNGIADPAFGAIAFMVR